MDLIVVGILLLKLSSSLVYSQTEEKHWLGPTIHTWGDNQCEKLGNFPRDNVGACKKTCEETESCNAIAVRYEIVQISCVLRSCPIPIPAPVGGPPWGNVKDCEDNKDCGGYYRATAKFKCPDLDVVVLGSTKCNKSDDSKIPPKLWFHFASWDDGQNCLPGCISRMNEVSAEEACCEAVQMNGVNTWCYLYDAAVDVVQGDDDSTDKKAVKCKGPTSSTTTKTSTTIQLKSSGTSTTAKRPTTSSKAMSTTTKSLDVTTTNDQMIPRTIERDDPDGGADSGSSTCKLNGKKKIFLMIHVTIAQMLLMLFVIKHKNV